MKNFSLLLIALLTNFCSLIGQPSIMWQKSLGGSGYEQLHCVNQTFDSGYILAGYSQSNDSDVTGNHGVDDCWIVKLSSNGNIQWEKSLGGTANEEAYSIQQTFDSGYIFVGTSTSADGDLTFNHGHKDIWIVKLDSIGNIQWQRSYGGFYDDEGGSVQQTRDSGYIIAGTSASVDGDVIGNHNSIDYWIFKIDNTGNIQWQNSLGGTNWDYAGFIQQTFDNGFIVSGRTESNDLDVTGFHGFVDVWIVKLNSSGAVEWKKTYGGSDFDSPGCIRQTLDSGYIFTAATGSTDGDVSSNYGLYDYWLVKLDKSGIIQWQKIFGGSGSDNPGSLHVCSDNGFVIAGHTDSNDSDVTGNHGQFDMWILKTDSIGNLQWEKTLGGTDWDFSSSVLQTQDLGFMIGGTSFSNDGDVSGNNGSRDYWIVKLDSSASLDILENTYTSVNLKISPNPFSNSTNISFHLSTSKTMRIEIRDFSGRQIRNFTGNDMNDIVWDGSNNRGLKCESGMYYVTLVSENFNETKKVIFLNRID